MSLETTPVVHMQYMHVHTYMYFSFQMGPRPRLSMYSRKRIQVLLQSGATIPDITDILKMEGIVTCRQTVWRMKRHIDLHRTLKPLPKSGRPTKLNNNYNQLKI